MFGKTSDRPTQARQVDAPPDNSKRNAELEALAVAAEPAVLVKCAALFAEMLEHHAADTAGYAFDCRRHGDFLAVFVDRMANESAWGGEPDRQMVAALNLGRARAIKFHEGRAPDREGAVGFDFSGYHPSDTRAAEWGAVPVNEGLEYRPFPTLPYVPRHRPLVVLPAPPKQDNGLMQSWGGNSYRIKHTITGTPRAAEDDRIEFVGIDATIHAPAGMGRAVYEKILAAKHT